ncbi:short chain dehydrogenase reductase [Colletotrichum incanum]|uniref:Short chain dehydrogenase reductase n=1 Tax=Colletotrichum incanum TaxID=1573173 RepID=A0A161VDQ6_COLIC|nr:short chain dehydrogenase reductase [Colletotrichum incanum]OHW92585.1 short chain dehydrogenase reductase [Colletotrichum incanum]
MSFPSPTKTFHRKTYATISPSRAELSTKGRHAFISGGGAGIGASIAQSLAKSGISSLGLLGRSVKSLEDTKSAIEALNPETKVHLYAADITDAEAITDAVTLFSESIGGEIDILIANAAYMADIKSIPDSDPSDWWRAFEISVRGNFNLLRAFHPHATPSASVIHISTAAVHLPHLLGHSAYRASKSAATKMFEHFLGENPNFFVLQVHPGLIGGTAMSEKFASSVEELGLLYDDIALPGDFVVWALSREAAFLNGRFVHANWDVEELNGLRDGLEKDQSRFTIGLQGWF